MFQTLDNALGVSSAFNDLRRMKKRHLLTQLINFGLVVASALMIWKSLMVITMAESPIVVVLTGSMEPFFHRGDLLFLYQTSGPIRSGDIPVFKLKEREIPIVHRVIRVHERNTTRDPDLEVEFLTKGDNNPVDDRGLYPPGQLWLEKNHLMGRVYGHLPKVGMVTIIMNDYPALKFFIIGFLGLLVILGKDA
eukprot:TRINITY_DN72_c0_g1_i1.p1 TRINITY_DN72_c0_g1~~TRINITY_DN72_c0_g1_i1.p1  ORF type:complete len:193 (-),score=26.12 TRINITY_DN72_c0_g1_i1:200-778(-)